MSLLTVRRVGSEPDPGILRALVSQYIGSWYSPGEPWSPSDMSLVASLPAGHTCFVARLSESPVGVVLVRDSVAGYAEVRKLFVVPSARSRGVGAALMGAVLEYARAHSLTLVGDVEATRGPAIRLYDRLGFEERTTGVPGFRSGLWTSR